ncbi:serine acetyltransferase [Verrucomicrobia bacterium]|nr:serine acetyltransferase [Verrucomicrobiota bacterium]MDA7662179.1 serine acetyltransferase [Verrucomicrobiota bacterium]
MNELIKKLTDDLLASYANLGGINHLDGVNLPSKSTIAEITRDLLRLLFPGYFDDHLIHSCELRIETANLMDNVFGRLEDEVYKSLLHSPPEGVKPDEIRHCAHEMTGQLLVKLPDLRELLQTDVESAYNGDPAALNKNEIIVAYPFVEAIAVQRLAHEIFQRKIPLIPRIMTEWAHSRTGIDLHPGARIGSHFFIDHGTGTVVGETSVIGNHVKMYQGVALIGRSLKGGQSLRGVKRHPTIEDKVTLYANATVMGGDTIVGARSTIGANVFLTQSIPPDSLAITDEVSVKIMNKLEHKPN